MKIKILLGLAALALAHGAWGADAIWVNPSDTVVPSTANTNAPIIDAVSFLNPQGLTFSISDIYGNSALYGFTDCLNITNKGYMYGSPGFDFENITVDGQYRPAAWFVNQAGGFYGGVIDITGNNQNFFFGGLPTTDIFLFGGNGKLLVRATNIINSGSMLLGDSTLLQLKGDYVDLTWGSLIMTNPATSTGFFTSGILDGDWGVGLKPFGGVPFDDYGGNGIPNFAPSHVVTNRLFQSVSQFLPMNGAVAYTNQTTPVNSNMLTQIVFLSNPNPAFSNSVFFSSRNIQVQWQWLSTNYPNTDLETNYLLLTDTFGERTNLQVAANGFVGALRTFKPVNYNFSRNPGLGTPAPVITNTDLLLTNLGLPFNNQTNPYSGYQAIFLPGGSLPSDTATGDVTNNGGRVEITANSALKLDHAHITSLNYLLLNSPGHFVGNTGAQISSPNTDLILNSTNGLLTVTNLVPPFVNFPAELVNLYSCRFTNDNYDFGGTGTNFVTNAFHVLFVESTIAPVTTPLVQRLDLTANNLVICDVLNVNHSLSLKAQSLTIASNTANPFVPFGQINLLSSALLWPTSTPGLRFMTNSGLFSSLNAVFFGGSRSEPAYDPTGQNIPYQTFVNFGTVSNQGTYVWSQYFENSGTIDCGTGPFVMESVLSGRMHGGLVDSFFGETTLNASDLIVSNTEFFSGGGINLAVTNYLDDGSYLSNVGDLFGSGNLWLTANGINLRILPAYASLLSTTVYCENDNRQPQTILWAGKDLGANATGFYNNAALGSLSLYGFDTESSFVFVPAGDTNAIYVDYLDLNGSAASMDANGHLANVVIPANMKVYFGLLTTNGGFADISGLINATNNPNLVWVPTALTTTPPSNPPPVYPPLVLDYSSPVTPTPGGGNPGNPPVASGPNKLDLPGETRAAGPSGNFVAASYSGLFADTNGISYNSSGYFTVRTTPQGRFTGKVTVHGVSYSFTGKLTSATDVANVSIPQAGLALSFWLSASDASQLNGQVSGSGWVADLVAFRQANQKSVPAAASLRGSYTLLIPGATNGPLGTGFGTVKTDAGGNVRWAGTLADGSKVTQGSFFSSGGLWGLYASLYGGHGSALGWLQLSSGTGTNLSGQCLWVKPKGLGSRYYVNGFTNDVEAIGSSYVRPRSGAALSLNSGAGTLTFSGAGLSSAVSAAVELNAHNKLTSTSSLAPVVTINPSSGLFTGSVFLPGLGGKVTFQGALFQNGNFAAGNFLGSTQSGNVSLTPAP